MVVSVYIYVKLYFTPDAQSTSIHYFYRDLTSDCVALHNNAAAFTLAPLWFTKASPVCVSSTLRVLARCASSDTRDLACALCNAFRVHHHLTPKLLPLFNLFTFDRFLSLICIICTHRRHGSLRCPPPHDVQACSAAEGGGGEKYLAPREPKTGRAETPRRATETEDRRSSPTNLVPTAPVVPHFQLLKFASGPKTLDKMLSGVQCSTDEMLPVVPKKATNLLTRLFFVVEIWST